MARAWALKSRPSGMPTADNFELKEFADAALNDGEIRVANSFLSVDPYMRGRMNDVKSYVPPFALGEAMTGGAVGVVTESKSDAFAVGDRVMHMLGWRDTATMPTTGAMAPNKLPASGLPIEMFLGNMGLTGATAWFGLLDTAEAREGDIVFVSAAAGAVGSAVVQIAKARGMTVIGAAGGPDKCTWVKELGADACIDYKAGSVLKQLYEAAQALSKEGGIDVYFDNVGGEHLDAALASARMGARFAICGVIDVYNSGEPMALKYFSRVIGMRLQIKGLLFNDFAPRMGEFLAGAGALVASGQLKSRDTVFEGLDSAPDAFMGLFTGANTGKMLVKI